MRAVPHEPESITAFGIGADLDDNVKGSKKGKNLVQ